MQKIIGEKAAIKRIDINVMMMMMIMRKILLISIRFIT